MRVVGQTALAWADRRSALQMKAAEEALEAGVGAPFVEDGFGF